MKGLKKALTVALALTMCFGATLTAMAGVGGTKDNPAEAYLSKTVSYAKDLSTPEAEFTFEFAAKGKDGRADTEALVPAIANQTINFTAGEAGTTTGAVTKVTKDTADLVAGIDWEAADGAGTYVWTVTERQSGAVLNTGEAMDYSKASFELIVKVAYDAVSDSYYVEETKTSQLTDNAGNSATGKGGAETGDGDYNFSFTNIFSREGGEDPGEGEGNNEALAISKIVVDGVDANKDFSFTITLDDSVAGHTAGTYVGTVYNGTTATATTYSVAGDGSATFTLKQGQRLVFHDMPVGTVVNVTEAGTAGYTPVISGSMAAANGADGEALSTGDNAIKKDVDNTVIFTNTYDNSNIPTGVLANNLPFIILIGAGLLAVAAFAVVNRRKAMR